MLKLKTYDNGKVVNGTFSKKVNGIAYPTKAAIYILTEAFELDKHDDPYKQFTRETREILSDKYNVSVDLMILSGRDLGMRINGEDNVIRIGRDLAFAAYRACK